MFLGHTVQKNSAVNFWKKETIKHQLWLRKSIKHRTSDCEHVISQIYKLRSAAA